VNWNQAKLDKVAALHDLAHASGYARYDSLYALAEFCRHAPATRILELGVYRGCSAVFMARACGASIVGIDDFTQAPMTVAQKNLEAFGLADRVQLIKGDTRVANQLTAGPFDLVFFDACHTNEGVLAEFKAVRPLLAPRALLVVDDSLHVHGAIGAMATPNGGLRNYSVHFGLCAIVYDRALS